MQATSDLTKLHRSMMGRLDKIDALIARAAISSDYTRRVLISYCILELDNLILGGNRMFVGSCLTQTRTANGMAVSTSAAFSSQEHVGAFILSVLKRTYYVRLGSPVTVSRRDEPSLRNPRDVLKVIVQAGTSNANSVQNALALNFGVFDEIAAMRNFCAHRNGDTMARARQMALNIGIPNLRHVDELFVRTRPRRPVSVMRDWSTEIRTFMTELVQ